MVMDAERPRVIGVELSLESLGREAGAFGAKIASITLDRVGLRPPQATRMLVCAPWFIAAQIAGALIAVGVFGWLLEEDRAP